MGERYNLSHQEIKNAQLRILEQLHSWQERKSIDSLILFLIWLYEFLEVISVNNTGKQLIENLPYQFIQIPQ